MQSHHILYPADVPEIEKTRLRRRDCWTQLALSLGRCNLTTVLVIRKHDGEAIPQREVIPREVKPLAAREH
jgi:hypothetical protein